MATFLFVLFARRYAQLLHPQVWDEESNEIAGYAAHGLAALLTPLNGYFVLAPRAITLLALLVSFSNYPFVSTVIAWAFTLAVLVAVAFSPIYLRGGVLLALAVLLVPTDPEVMGVPLYALWWAGLLLFPALLWRANAPYQRWRYAMIVVGGLSSPLITVMAPLHVIRAAFTRNRSEIIAAGIAVATSIAQWCALATSGPVTVRHASEIFRELPAAIVKFAGTYTTFSLVGSLGWFGDVVTTVMTLTVGALAVLALRHPAERVLIGTLIALYVATVALSLGRAPLPAFDPVGAGPRYYFYPDALLAWLLLAIVLSAVIDVRARIVAALVLGISAFNTLPVLARTHDLLPWAEPVAQCLAAPGDTVSLIPIQYDGHAASAWTMKLSGSECRRLNNRSFLIPTASP